MHWWQFMRTTGWWQLRLWLPRHTLRLSCQRKSIDAGWIKGGWERGGVEGA